jgi:hypothetical protein
VFARNDDNDASAGNNSNSKNVISTGWSIEATLTSPTIGGGSALKETLLAIDQDIIVIGDPKARKPQEQAKETGAVYIYRRTTNSRTLTSSWVLSQTLWAPDGFDGYTYGSSFTLDGVILVIAQWARPIENRGAIYSYYQQLGTGGSTRTDSNQSTLSLLFHLHQVIRASDVNIPEFAHSVALQDHILAVGARHFC